MRKVKKETFNLRKVRIENFDIRKVMIKTCYTRERLKCKPLT